MLFFCAHAFIMLLIICTAFKTQAQDFFPEQTDHGIRVGLDYELPGSNLRDTYKPAINYNLGFMKFYDNITASINFSYRMFEPKAGVLTEQIAGAQAITTTSTFNTFLLYINIVYNIPVTERVRAYAGANLGGGYTSSSVGYTYTSTNNYFDNSGKQTYFAPKVGFNIALNNNWDLDLHASYNMLLQGAIEYDNQPNYLGAPAVTYTSISTGAGLVFKF